MLLAKCINNVDPWGNKKTDLIIDKYYFVENVNMGQSYTTITINGVAYNSVLFKFYDDFLKPVDIYIKYNPYKIDTNSYNEEEEQRKIAEFEVKRYLSTDKSGVILYIFSNNKKLKSYRSKHKNLNKDIILLTTDEIINNSLAGFKIKNYKFIMEDSNGN